MGLNFKINAIFVAMFEVLNMGKGGILPMYSRLPPGQHDELSPSP